MSGTPPAVERRRAVRMRPTPDYPISVWLLDARGEHALSVADVSVGGLAVFRTLPTLGFAPESRHRVRIKTPAAAPFEVEVEVRHVSGAEHGIVGLMVVSPTGAVISALGRYVAELLERGASS